MQQQSYASDGTNESKGGDYNTSYAAVYPDHGGQRRDTLTGVSDYSAAYDRSGQDQQAIPGAAYTASGGGSGSGSRSRNSKGQIFEDILKLGSKG